MSLLTRSRERPVQRRPVAAAAAGDELAQLRERVTSLEADKALLTAQLSFETEAKNQAVQTAANERDRCTGYEEKLSAAQDGRRAAEADAAAARSEVSGLREQLAREQGTVETLKGSLAQAIAETGKNHTMVHPAPASEPPVYEMEVTGRDANGRTGRVVLRPIREEA